jgi:hypothetical protein
MPKIRFLHIQKTGGSTVYAILRRQYFLRPHAHLYGRSSDPKEYLALSERDRRNVTLVLGHTPLITGIAAIDEMPVITFLRDPIERVKSLCQHIWEGKSSLIQAQFPAGNFRLDDLLDSHYFELHNFQTSTLCSEKTIRFLGTLSPREADAMTERAIDYLLNRVVTFGLNEYFDESLMLMRTELAWKLPPFYVIRNSKNHHRSLEFEPRHLDRIRAMNAMDIKLYEAAQQHFLKKLSGHGLSARQLQQFRTRNRRYGDLMQRLPKTQEWPPPLNRLVGFLR